MFGGWNIAEPIACGLPERAASAFGKAVEGLIGATYTPVCYLGDQLVEGTNYAILCHLVLADRDHTTKYAVAYIYEDLQGNVSLKTEDILCG